MSHVCPVCGMEIVRQSNADCIRKMTDEELAAFCMALRFGDGAIPFCKNKKDCTDLLERKKRIPREMCEQCMLDWLRKEKRADG